MHTGARSRFMILALAVLYACSAPRASSTPSSTQPPQPPPRADRVTSPDAGALVVSPVPASPVKPRTAFPLPVPELLDAPPDASGWGSAGGLHYLELVRGDARADEPLPLLLLIHGLGDRPKRDWLDVIDVDEAKVRMILPQAPTPYGGGFAWFESRFRDQDPDAMAQGISEAAERLARMLSVLQTQRPTRGRAVVCGFSQGGMLSYALALRHPQLVRYAVPISGMLPPRLWPQRRPKGRLVPLHALHGTADPVVAFDADQRLVAHLARLGFPAELAVFAGVGHTISPAMSQDAVSALVRALGGR